MINKRTVRTMLSAGFEEDKDAAGFALYEPEVFCLGQEESVIRVKLLVPINRYEEIVALYKGREKQRLILLMERREAECAAAESVRMKLMLKMEREQEEAEAEVGAKYRVSVLPKINTNSPPLPLREVAEDTDYSAANQHPVYLPRVPAVMYARAQTLAADKDVKRRDLELSHQLARNGVLRLVAVPESTNLLEKLFASHPNFREVTNLVCNQIVLAQKSERAPRIPPILLDGEPGLGKTHFASALAKAIGAPVQHISFDASITAARLTGGDRHWANTSVGALFESVCLGTHANPVFVLDEIDKATGRVYQDPVAALHSLLEPSTASRVRDLSADMEFDASLVTWITTSNQARLLRDSLRSRFRKFHITRPTAEESIIATQMMVESILEDLNLDDFFMPYKSFLVALAHLVPREVQRAVQQAVAGAVAAGRTSVRLDDIPTRYRDDDNKPKGGSPWLH